MNLYQLTEQQRAIRSALSQEPVDQETGEVTTNDDLRALYDALQGTAEQRIEQVMQIVADLEADAKACTDEAKRLRDVGAAYTREAESLLRLARQSMIDSLTTATGGRFPLRLQKNPGHVEVYAASELPEQYRRIPPPSPWVPDLKGLTGPLKAGEQIPGARWAEGDLVLRRK